MTCHSGGTLEIYVEPHLPAPYLWVAGTTPIAGALVALGATPAPAASHAPQTNSKDQRAGVRR